VIDLLFAKLIYIGSGRLCLLKDWADPMDRTNGIRVRKNGISESQENMGKIITAIRVQKKNKERVSIDLDGKFAFGLSRIVAAWLRVGQNLSDAEIEKLHAQETNETAYLRALNLLSYRPRSSAEIRARLQKQDTADEVIEDVLARLQRTDLVNDRKFARIWVENRSEFSPRGRRALRVELRQKDISPEIIEEVLEKIDEPELAYRAGAKKARNLKNKDRQEFRRKLSAFLARRGFDYETIKPVLNQLWENGNTSTMDWR
jgi:regulatory protein